MVSRRTKRPRQKAPKRNANLVKAVQRGLDSTAMAYKKLLLDPCNSELAYPVYGGSDGTYLIRAESYVTIAAGAGEPYGYLSWVPGILGASEIISAKSRDLLWGWAASPTADVVPAAPNDSSVGITPGYNFLRANASSHRCVAACATIMYTGPESARAGLVAYGNASGALVGEKYFDAQPIQVLSLMSSLPNSEKSPASQIEINWVPNQNDSLFHNPDDSASAELACRKGAIVLAFSGMDVSKFTIKLTAVYEYKPKYGTGIVQPQKAIRSTNTLTDVLNSINSAMGNPWIRQAGYQAAAGILGLLRTNVNRRRGVTFHDEM